MEHSVLTAGSISFSFLLSIVVTILLYAGPVGILFAKRFGDYGDRRDAYRFAGFSYLVVLLACGLSDSVILIGLFVLPHFVYSLFMARAKSIL